MCLTNEAVIFPTPTASPKYAMLLAKNSEEKLLDFLRQHTSDGTKEFKTKLLNHMEAYRSREPWPDDITG